MKTKQDHPGVYIPPPIIYAAVFVIAYFIQKLLPINKEFFLTSLSTVMGIIIIAPGFFFILPAMFKFLKTKNTLITVKPARSLQMSGIYSISRNPMYVSLLLFYIGLSFMIGNWWNFILLPLLILFVQGYIIQREEKYLDRKFGQEYLDYKRIVRRWI